ncbi:MAG: hypothetical protein AB7M05_17425 [Alphaproteobacteria bacterium]
MSKAKPFPFFIEEIVCFLCAGAIHEHAISRLNEIAKSISDTPFEPDEWGATSAKPPRLEGFYRKPQELSGLLFAEERKKCDEHRELIRT